MSLCLWRLVVGMALFGFVATLEVPAAVAREPTALTDQTKSFEGPDRDAAHEAAMKWIEINQPATHKANCCGRAWSQMDRDRYLHRGRVG